MANADMFAKIALRDAPVCVQMDDKSKAYKCIEAASGYAAKADNLYSQECARGLRRACGKLAEFRNSWVYLPSGR
jgi:hypothetical protein